MYRKGQGVTKDDAQAVQWYRKAADQGHETAQFYLGYMYNNGQGVAKDDAQAVQWFRKAADQGHAAAQFNLGIMYGNGQGVAKDAAQAAQLYRKAAEQGHASAQNSLGVLYKDGKGVSENLIVAYAWLNLAAVGGQPNAGEERDAIAVNLTSKQLQQGQELSSSWKQGTLIAEVVYKPIKEKHASYVQDFTAHGIYPAQPAKRTGVVSCNTKCNNGDCYRTYDSGKKVHFQAKQKWNPFNNAFEWDSGSC
jgi:hypothetical protein